ncbi:MAG: DUF4367 domain-containing protein [Eubacterium sp.]|nr:DUF4367 domain-containing protein [Eubacterium sp.]
MKGDFDKTVKFIKAAAVAAFMVICAACVFLTSGNELSFFDISGSRLEAMRNRETEKIDCEGSGFEQYSTIKDVEEHIGLKLMLPSYLPKGYDVGYVIYSDMAESAVINFSSEDITKGDIQLCARLMSENRSIMIEKDDTPVTKIIHNNTEYNVFGNNGETVIEWMDNGYSYMLSGTIEEKEVKKIVNNIR